MKGSWLSDPCRDERSGEPDGAAPIPSNVVDLNCRAPGSNMYGCQPCPRCGGGHRFARNDRGFVIICDDCDFEEPGIRKVET